MSSVTIAIPKITYFTVSDFSSDAFIIMKFLVITKFNEISTSITKNSFKKSLVQHLNRPITSIAVKILLINNFKPVLVLIKSQNSK
jgi:hypothetical protein